MTSEDPKQTDQAAASQGSEEHGTSDESSTAPLEKKLGTNLVRPIARSSADIFTEDRWDDSEIDAAVGVLERPSQVPPSNRDSTSQPAELDEQAPPRERPSLSASAVEKSKRSSDAPAVQQGTAVAPESKPRVQVGSRQLPRPPARSFPEVPKPSPPSYRTQALSAPKVSSAESEFEEATQFIDRPSPQPSTDSAGKHSDEPEEVTRYFDRAELLASDAKPAPSLPEAEETTQYYDRASLPTMESSSDTDDATKFLERPNPELQQHAAAEPTTHASGDPAAEVPSARWATRQSSVPLGVGVALMSAETTEPPPVVAKRAAGQAVPLNAATSDSLRAKVMPPRPAGVRVSGEPSDAPSAQAPEPSPATELPTRPAQEGRTPSDAEPMSERSDGVVGTDIEPPAQGLTGVTAFSIAPRPGSAGFEEEAWLDPIGVRAGRRLLRAATACALVAFGLALVDSWYARVAAADQPSWWQLALACAGLLVPLSLLIACLVTGLSILLHPDAAPALHRLPQKLRPTDIRRQARLAVILGVAPLAMSIWIILVARAALPLLGSNAAAPVIGTLLAALSVGFGLLVAAPVLAVARYFGVRLRQRPPDPVRWGWIGILVGVTPLAIAVATGPTSGAGAALAIFGVFKRPELDLRLPSMLLAMALAGYLLPTYFRGVRWVWLLLIALLPFGLTARAATRGLDNRAVALAIERGAPLSRTTLAALRKLTDRDHDGFSKYFGGGDCDERSRSRNPGADDVPENGIDEDCSGSDAVAVKAPAPPATPLEVLRERRGAIPENLNLILIIVDTLRSDVLRHPKRITPRLDELLDSSVNVQLAYAPASYTGKSVGPILIGKHSSETNRDFAHFAAFSRKDTFVQQRLRAAGIRTLSVQSYWYFFQTLYGFDRGFDVIDSDAAVGNGYVEGDRSTTGEKLTDRILLQLGQSENTSDRFFLWTQYTDPHAEYVPHAGIDFGSDSRGRYHGEVAFVDQQVGRIVDFVRSQPWGSRTAIVVTSDHGEAFGEHGMIRHGFELWEPLVRVPLVFHVPGVEARQIGSRRSLIDVVPTILDLMQIALPEGSGTDFVSGRSLLPELLGIEGSDVPRPVLVDMAHGPFTAERQAYIDGDTKLLTAMGRPTGLFDLATDPDEKRDLLDDPTLRERIVGEYRAFKKGMRVVDVRAK